MVPSGDDPNDPADRKNQKRTSRRRVPKGKSTQEGRLGPFLDVWWVRGYFGPCVTQASRVPGSHNPAKTKKGPRPENEVGTRSSSIYFTQNETFFLVPACSQKDGPC